MELTFHVGQSVRTKIVNPRGHCRLPRYARGRVGTIERCQGTYPLPDREADPRAESKAGSVYTVCFAAKDLWGEGDHTISLDVWSAYLEPVS